MGWQATASFENLKKRAALMEKIRAFFKARNILEVETPLISHSSVTDPHVLSMQTSFVAYGTKTLTPLFLQTSPEYAMKRLLACGFGPIFQICKAFRQGDLGRLHNPEFTMLEWYRPDFNHHDLMDEMDLFLQDILQTVSAERLSYEMLFEKFLNVNPHTVSVQQLKTHPLLPALEKNTTLHETDKDFWLNVLLTHCIEPFIGRDRPIFIYDFPVSQAALAKIRDTEKIPVASRFEVHFKGLELANGFHELQDAKEQRARFLKDLKDRQKQQRMPVPIDENFLAALMAGLPNCSGVALGVDRLMMLALNANAIKEVISFPFERAT